MGFHELLGVCPEITPSTHDTADLDRFQKKEGRRVRPPRRDVDTPKWVSNRRMESFENQSNCHGLVGHGVKNL